jgi:hypothetical protein
MVWKLSPGLQIEYNEVRGSTTVTLAAILDPTSFGSPPEERLLVYRPLELKDKQD